MNILYLDDVMTADAIFDQPGPATDVPNPPPFYPTQFSCLVKQAMTVQNASITLNTP
jgi:hypothetical protein